MNCDVLLLALRLLPSEMTALPTKCFASFSKFLATLYYIFSISASAGDMCLLPGTPAQLFRYQSLEPTNSGLSPSFLALVSVVAFLDLKSALDVANWEIILDQLVDFGVQGSLLRKALEPLEKFQNRVMRFILGCPLSIRIVKMQSEFDLPPLVERIYANVTYLSVKCLHSTYPAPQFSAVIRTSLDPDAPRFPLRPGGHNLINAVCNNLRGLDITVPEEAAVPGLPPWRVPLPIVTFRPTSKDVSPLLQKQLPLETIAGVSTSVPAAPHIYVDGSVQADGSAACAMFSPNMDPPGEDEWLGRRLPNSSSSIFSELHGILDAVTLLVQRQVNGVIVCDSQSALYSLSSPRPSCGRVVRDILCQLAIAHNASLVVFFRVDAFSHRAGW
ncbi:hypothetical protein GWK47_032401 [Chionoecetes opilio]|uniref:RNase H type-1 domain-containing protein n=1 Tax=Chionoecetes opilio TaxID=41210 RepID=A0A8J5D1N0_CHIOP|nr:hypothetical protein GWK47_032401 [Chionoecetes opilio]